MRRRKRIAFILVFVVQYIAGFKVSELESGAKIDHANTQSVLSVYTWEDYLDPEIISDFEKEYRVNVNTDFYDDEEVMFSSVQSQPDRYDIVFPSDSLTDVMLRSGLLSKIKTEHVPNVTNLMERFRVIINKRWKWCCVPFDWGVTGIVYNAKHVSDVVDSWSIFWKTKYTGKMALLNNGYDVITVGQKIRGYSLNPISSGEIEDSLKILKLLKPLLLEEGFMPYCKIIEYMKNEKLWIAQCYNGDAALIKEENNNIKFVVPKEGTGLWLDNIAIPAGAKNKRLAERFINFMLRPDISARHTKYSYYANCNKRAWKFIDKKILDNPYVYIDKKILGGLEMYEVLRPDIQSKFNECWAELLKH